MNKIGLIVEREFTERVRKKSFIISTLLTPLFMIAMMVLPSVLMLKGNSDTKNVVVIDNSPEQFVGKQLASGKTVSFNLLAPGETLNKARMEYKIGGYFMHARGGLQTEYMGEEWFDNIAALKMS